MYLKITTVIIVILLSLGCGFMFNSFIADSNDETISEVNKAIQIQSQDQFLYGMETNVGNSFSYGLLIAKDPIKNQDLNGAYSELVVRHEMYTMHERNVTETVNGETVTKVETYWSWDVVDTETYESTCYEYMGVLIDSNELDISCPNRYIDTVENGDGERNVYEGRPDRMEGTMYVYLKPQITNADFYQGLSIDETIDYLSVNIGGFFFWIIWLALSGCICVKIWEL